MTNITILGVFRTEYKDVKWGVGVESARFHGIVNGESLWNVFMPTEHILLPNNTSFRSIRVIWKFGVCNYVNMSIYALSLELPSCVEASQDDRVPHTILGSLLPWTWLYLYTV